MMMGPATAAVGEGEAESAGVARREDARAKGLTVGVGDGRSVGSSRDDSVRDALEGGGDGDHGVGRDGGLEDLEAGVDVDCRARERIESKQRPRRG